MNEKATAPKSSNPLASLDFIEPLLTVREAADALRISYDSARRQFKDKPGVLIISSPSRYKRPYSTYKIPVSVLRREWQQMASRNTRKAA